MVETKNAFDMKKILLLAALAITAASCQESLEDRAEREAREFTEKNCPVQLTSAITSDSLVFERDTKTLHYYMSVRGDADTIPLQYSGNIEEDMIMAIKSNTSVIPYKEARYKFKYTYLSTKHPGQVIYEMTITADEYTKMRSNNTIRILSHTLFGVERPVHN